MLPSGVLGAKEREGNVFVVARLKGHDIGSELHVSSQNRPLPLSTTPTATQQTAVGIIILLLGLRRANRGNLRECIAKPQSQWLMGDWLKS
jgi:hypothetical protein